MRVFADFCPAFGIPASPRRLRLGSTRLVPAPRRFEPDGRLARRPALCDAFRRRAHAPSDRAMSNDAPLTPAEAAVLLAPNLGNGAAAVKATLLFLLVTGVLRMETVEEQMGRASC